MKIGYFVHSRAVGTAETFIYDMLKGLWSKNHEITFYSGMHPKTEIELSFPVDIVKTGFSQKGENISFLAYKLGYLLGGRQFKFKMQVQKSLAFKQLKKCCKHMDIAYVEYGTNAVLCREYFESHNIPYIIHFHGFDITSALNDPEYRNEIKEVFRTVNYVIVPSHHLKRLAILNGCAQEKIVVQKYGINENALLPLSWVEKIKSAPSIIHLGRLTPKKNPIALLHAFKIVNESIPEAKLTIIGDGELRQEVEETIEKLGIAKNVKLLGALPREKALLILKEHWVYAQHSVTALNGDQEGFPVSMVEAAAFCLPIVSTIHSGISENVTDGITGYLVQEHNYELMAAKIIYLLKNPEEAQRMGNAGRENILKSCKLHERIELVYQLLIRTTKLD